MSIGGHRVRVRIALRGLLLSGAVWVILIAIGLLFHGNWPHATPDVPTCFTYNPIVFHPDRCRTISAAENWRNFLALAVIVEFLWMKSYMMAVMTLPGRLDALGLSLISANLAFAALYLLAMGLTLWPAEWGATAREATRDALIVVLFVGIVQLIRVPDRVEPADGEMAVTG